MIQIYNGHTSESILKMVLSLIHDTNLQLRPGLIRDQFFDLGEAVVVLEALRIEQRSRRLDNFAGDDLLDW